MSLEAIAALLGHRSMRMTLTYARISDRTIADEYFRVTEPSRTLPDRRTTPTDATGPNMRRLAADHRRLLGNGHCARPVALDCRFETICERCGFYETGPHSSTSSAANATTPPTTATTTAPRSTPGSSIASTGPDERGSMTPTRPGWITRVTTHR